jgi:hypothetical protein
MSDKFFGGIRAGSTSVSIVVHLTKSGAAVAGLVAADLTMYYFRTGAAAPLVQALSDLVAVNSAFAAGGLKELSAAHAAGDYRLDLPDAMLATGVDFATLNLMPAAAKTDTYAERLPLSINVSQSGDSYPTINTNLNAAISTISGGVLSTIGTGDDMSLKDQLARLKNEPTLTLVFKMKLTDHVTEATGKTPACSFARDSGAFVAAINTPAIELTGGDYKLVVAAADGMTNAGLVRFRATAAGCDPVEAAAVLQNN